MADLRWKHIFDNHQWNQDDLMQCNDCIKWDVYDLLLKYKRKGIKERMKEFDRKWK